MPCRVTAARWSGTQRFPFENCSLVLAHQGSRSSILTQAGTSPWIIATAGSIVYNGEL